MSTKRRLQLKGDLFREGSWWKLRWRETKQDGQYGWSKPVRIGPCTGAQALTKTDARRIAKRDHLDGLEANLALQPRSAWTLEQFCEHRFLPDRVAIRKPNTQTFYSTMLRIVLKGVPESKMKTTGRRATEPDVPRENGLGALALNAISHTEVQQLLNRMRQNGYSVRVMRHARAVVRTVFEYADQCGYWSGRNPGKHVVLPEAQPARVRRALTLPELARLLNELTSPVREMAMTAALTGMGIAELCGLRWGRVNLGPESVLVDADVELPPMTLLVAEQYDRHHGYGTVKAVKRNRKIPISPVLANAFRKIMPDAAGMSLSSPVFCNRHGRPVDAANALRALKTGGARAGCPWVAWHDLRRTFATLTDSAGLTAAQRQVLMGHATPSMTSHYTLQSSEAARPALDAIAQRLLNG